MESTILEKSTDICGPPDGSDDEDSFVVLETTSSISSETTFGSSGAEMLPPLRTNKVHEMQNIILMKISQIDSEKETEASADVEPLESVVSAISRTLISPDLSYEEIQKQVEDLIKENERLKNTITQNTMTLKANYERFKIYKEEVAGVMQQHKDKFNEAKSLIEKNKEENKKLAEEIEVHQSIKKLNEEEIINLKEKVRELESLHYVGVKTDGENLEFATLQGEGSSTSLKLSELTKENEKLKLELNDLKTKSDYWETKVEKEKQEVRSLQAVIARLDRSLQMKQEDMDKLTEKLVTTPKLEEELQTKQQEVNVLQFDISTLKNEVARLRAKNEELNSQLCNNSKEIDKLVQSASTSFSYEDQLKQKVAEFERLQIKIDELKGKFLDKSSELDETKSRYEEQMKIKNTDLERLKREVDEMELKLQKKADENIDLIQTFEEELKVKDAEIRNLQKELKQVTASQVPPSVVEECTKVRKQLCKAQQTITALEIEQQKKIKEIEDLRKLLQESSAKSDEMFALNEQLEIYKNDFEAERKSKEEIKREKTQLIEDVQNLQRRIKQLENELETLRARNHPKAEGYTCPKCSFGFSTYQSLENHVHRCLDLEGFP